MGVVAVLRAVHMQYPRCRQVRGQVGNIPMPNSLRLYSWGFHGNLNMVCKS